MIWLLALALLLLGVGTAVILVNWISGEVWFVAALRKRDIHPHLWGYHLIVGGLVPTLTLGSLNLMPWIEMSVFLRCMIAVQALWGLFAVGTAVLAFLGRSRGRGPDSGLGTVDILPGPDTGFTSWSLGYRVFLLLGLANTTLMVLLVW